jgi:hypothetical protein
MSKHINDGEINEVDKSEHEKDDNGMLTHC